jgi:hypothetical protein
MPPIAISRRPLAPRLCARKITPMAAEMRTRMPTARPMISRSGAIDHPSPTPSLLLRVGTFRGCRPSRICASVCYNGARVSVLRTRDPSHSPAKSGPRAHAGLFGYCRSTCHPFPPATFPFGQRLALSISVTSSRTPIITVSSHFAAMAVSWPMAIA